jgi:septal ring factor EnvC (AmiA/AmiB activator)
MTSKANKFLFVVFLMSCFIISFAEFALTADDATQKTKDLLDLKKDIEKIKKQKKGVIQKEQSLVTEIKKIDSNLNAKEKELDIYSKDLDKSGKELKIIESNLTMAQRNLKQTQEMLNSRLRAMYKLGYHDQRVSYLNLLIDSNNISDITSRYTYITSIAKADKNLLDKASKQKMDVTHQKNMVEEKKQQIVNNKLETEKVKNDILNKKQTQKENLNKVLKSKDELTKAQIELESSINRLERLITQLKKNQDQDVPSAKKNYNKKTYTDSGDGLGGQIGRLLWPTSGEIIENQAPSMKGVTIKADRGASIKCVDNGIVDHARWFDGIGYGNMIIINHGNNYRTLYAHASKILIKEGQEVSKGQIIGEVGDTGSLNGTSLYFEVWRGTEALPTRRWLGSR